jgi:hypothetical protein
MSGDYNKLSLNNVLSKSVSKLSRRGMLDEISCEWRQKENNT